MSAEPSPLAEGLARHSPDVTEPSRTCHVPAEGLGFGPQFDASFAKSRPAEGGFSLNASMMAPLPADNAAGVHRSPSWIGVWRQARRRFRKQLMVPVSNDTLLRVVRRRARLHADTVAVAGIDDCAFRRNHRYGTIVCDLERRRIVALLPDRDMTTVAAWLADHPEIGILSRDRGGGMGRRLRGFAERPPGR